eukprot:CAMPEP_0114129220 /NCGR_PEP_ID=MMETSP0043_2-20121206/11358_1 /TAXON_ID=464988 /ORGANISM="Hemiselmis andersenii, Strain CCMP644" /LENGTH=511 /DNA_ID=CAMNT_0001222479 /DNA_START=413 /DNA_END=1945 /DNA_ORIENTATION=+
MGCIPSKDSSGGAVTPGGGGADDSAKKKAANKRANLEGEGDDNESQKRQVAFTRRSSNYTRSVKQLVNEGLVLQPEFNGASGTSDRKGVLTKEPLPTTMSGSGRDSMRVQSHDTKSSRGEKMSMEELMQVSDEERSNRRADMKCTFRHLSSYPDLNKMFSETEVKVEDLTWDLDCFRQDRNEQKWQINATLAMFHSLGLLKRYDISTESLVYFLLTVKLNYNDMAFHNWLHAWSVMHASWLMISAPDVGECLTEGDKLAIMLAAVCHDLDHPGVNNDFLAKSKDPLSERYATPILERHHLAMTMDILCDSDQRVKVVHGLDSEKHKELMVMIEEAIMATDMGVHKSICEELQVRAERVAQAAAAGTPLKERSFSRDSFEDRVFLVRSIVHTADLSGQAMPKEVAYKFGAGVLTEFHHQYCKEAQLSLPLSGWMKDLDLALGQAKSQLGFITFVVLPLWASMGTIFTSLKPQVDRVQSRMEEIDFDNLDKWGGFVRGLQPNPYKGGSLDGII